MAPKQLSKMDVAFVVNIHNGRNFLARTMRSLEASALIARQAGLTVELLFALDRSPPDTAAWVAAYRWDSFDRCRIERYNNGSLGLSRQQGLDAACSHYVQFCDEDDLISSNMTLAMHEAAKTTGPATIIIPEYLFGFGTAQVLAHYCGTDEFSPLTVLGQHPFVSRIFVHCSIAERVRYHDVPVGSGHAYEDWHFNASAIAAGFAFKSAPNTVLFYRQSAQSMLSKMNTASTRQIPPTTFFEPANYLRICWESYYRRQSGEFAEVDYETIRRRFIGSNAIQEFLADANLIDPAVNPLSVASVPVMSNLVGDYKLGNAYFQACRRLGGEHFTDVVIDTNFGRPGDQGQQFDVVSVLAMADREVRTLILLHGSPHIAAPTVAPVNSVVLNLTVLEVGLTDDQIDTIALRIIESTAPTARLHLSSNAFALRLFAKYHNLLSRTRPIFHRTDDSGLLFGNHLIRSGAAFQFLSDYLESVDLVICDNAALVKFDQERLDRTPTKWRLLYRGSIIDSPPVRTTQRVLAIQSRQLNGPNLKDVAATVSQGATSVTIDAEEVVPLTLEQYDVLVLLDEDQPTYAKCWPALTHGLAIVAPVSPATLEATDDGRNGVLFEKSSNRHIVEAKLVQALGQIYATPESALAYRERAYRHFANRHSWSSFPSMVKQALSE